MEISNGFMTAKTIKKRINAILSLDVSQSSISAARKTILSEIKIIKIINLLVFNFKIAKSFL